MASQAVIPILNAETTSHDRKRPKKPRYVNVKCPQCSYQWEVLASRKTNHGHENARKLVYLLNTETIYEATSEPKSNQKRGSGVGMRPDIKVRKKNSRSGDPYIFVERQEQNTPGTGNEKIANKIHKANQALRNLDVRRYYIVLGGTRADLLQRVADDTFDNGNSYRHERLEILTEAEFIDKARVGEL